MSSFEELEDDLPEQPAAPAAAAAPGPSDLKAKLAALAQKKRQEAEEGGERKKKKSKGDKADGGEKKRKRDKGEDGQRSKKTRPQRKAGGEDDDDDADDAAEAGPQVSVDSQDIQENEADKDFIDDADNMAAAHEQIGDDEDSEEPLPPALAPEALEAEEADDAEEDLFGKKKKKKRKEEDSLQMGTAVTNLIAKMEAAAEVDADEHNEGRPAFNKLRMVSEVDDFLAQRKYHELFIHNGGLGVLKAWLEPYKDGSLPNTKIRTMVLNCCKTLPIDTAHEDMKDNLKRSQLGSRVMFLAKCPVENQANRKVALELVQKWSRPIFFDPEAEAEKRRQREEALKRARAQSQEHDKAREESRAAEEAAKSKIRYGQQGYRWHAVIPRSVKLDYVVAPPNSHDGSGGGDDRGAGSRGSQGMGVPVAAGGKSKKDEGRFDKKMREVVRKQKGSNARAAVPSVEGRNIVIMH